MKTFSEKDLEKKIGMFFCGEEQIEFACPKCGEALWNTGDIMWD